MALISCHECSKEISDKAPACPHCGVPSEDRPVQCHDCKRSITSATSYGFQSFPLCRDCDRKVRFKDKQRRNKESIEAYSGPVKKTPEEIAKDRATAPEGLKKDGQGKDEGFGKFPATLFGIGVFQISRALGLQFGAMTVVFMLVPWWVLHKFGKKQSSLGYVGVFVTLGLFYGLSLDTLVVEEVDIWRFAIVIPSLLFVLCLGRWEDVVFSWKRDEDK